MQCPGSTHAHSVLFVGPLPFGGRGGSIAIRPSCASVPREGGDGGRSAMDSAAVCPRHAERHRGSLGLGRGFVGAAGRWSPAGGPPVFSVLFVRGGGGGSQKRNGSPQPWPGLYFTLVSRKEGQPHTPPWTPPPQTKVTIVGKKEIYERENLLVQALLGPRPPSPPLSPL